VYGAYWCTARTGVRREDEDVWDRVRRRGSGARTGEERGWGCGLEGWGCGLEGRAGRAGKWVWVGSAGAEDEAARERRVELAGRGEGFIWGEKEMSFSTDTDGRRSVPMVASPEDDGTKHNLGNYIQLTYNHK